jgi:glutathione S-transferase
MTYVLHHAPDTAALIVRIALEALGQPYRLVPIAMADGGLRTPAFLALNPNGLTPVLETPDGPIFETGAILLWLGDRHGALVPGPTDPDRGRVLKWLFWLSNTLHASEIMLSYPDRLAAPGDDMGMQRRVGVRIAGQLDVLQNALPDLTAWIGGPGLSVLDCYLAALLRWPAIYGQGAEPGAFTLTRWPALRAAAARIEAHPAVQTVARAEGLGDRPITQPVAP